jgi:hypothetical protein
MIIDNSEAVKNGEWISSDFGKEFYGDNFIYNSTGEGSVSFQSWESKSGVYDIYAWWTASAQNSYQTDFEIVSGSTGKSVIKTQRTNGGHWNFIGDIEVREGNTLEVNVYANSTGLSVADAVRIIYRSPLSNVKGNPVPTDFRLYPNYPNPFNPATTIRFEINEHQHVVLSVYNSLGELVTTLIDEFLNPGMHEVVFNSNQHNNLSTGIYYYNLETNNQSETRGLLLLK